MAEKYTNFRVSLTCRPEAFNKQPFNTIANLINSRKKDKNMSSS
jgi:hypothetical protein